MRNSFAKIVAFIIGIGIFIGWMKLVGNPHVVETSMGLAISVIAGGWVYLKLSGTKR